MAGSDEVQDKKKATCEPTHNNGSSSSFDKLDTNVRRHWYPMSFSKHLVKGTPVGLHLLGDPVVLFRDKDGEACCLADVCAHRSAPLSIGRLTDGELECKYHGWRYNSEGKVTHIPAMESNKSVPRSACTRVYPCCEVDEVVWVFPGKVSKQSSLPEIPNLIPGKRRPGWGKPFDFAVDLNIDHCLMVENLLDPAHLPFTHENTLSKRSDATPLRMEELRAEVNKDDGSSQIIGIAHMPEWKGRRSKPPTKFIFQAPCTVIISTEIKPGWHFEQSMSCVPTRQGHMRLIFRQGRTFGLWVNRVIPYFDSLMEYFSLKIVMQDYELLHGQQTRLNQNARPWNVPIQVDCLPNMYRNWHKRAMSRNPWFQGYGIADIEDLGISGCGETPEGTPCTTEKKSGNNKTYYDENVPPMQKGVDNSAYFQKASSSSQVVPYFGASFLPVVLLAAATVSILWTRGSPLMVGGSLKF